MREIKIGEDCVIKIYASAQELPLDRYTKFQKYLLLETGVGATLETISTHFQKLHSFLANNMHDDAMTEAENLHFNFYSILQEINYTSLAFCCLIHTVNNESIDDFSEEALAKLATRLSTYGLTQGTIVYENDEVKKKS